MKFKPETCSEIKNYVYAYIDPDTMQPFYIGKGKDNRCFDHLSDQAETEKVNRIKELKRNNKEPIIKLLRYGLTENEAALLESTIIDFIGLDKLTNKARGVHSRSFGISSIEDINIKYTAEDVEIKDDKVILISIGKSFRSNMSPEELFEYSRGCWKVNVQKHKPEYALIIFQGIVREVYKIYTWYKAGTSTYTYRKESEINLPDRKEFDGKIAEDNIRNKYLKKSVRKSFSKGSRYPVKYVNC